MSLTLHGHPLSSFVHQSLIGLHENGTPFTFENVDFSSPEKTAAFKKMWPIGKMPVLRDAARDRVVPEATIIIEYVSLHYPGKTKLVPADPDLATQTRLRDRFYDLYIHVPMQKVVTDRLRPEGSRDAFGVEEAKKLMTTALGMVEQDLADKTWAMGDDFTMADCAAAPALFYAGMIVPLGKNASAYLDRLKERPSYARVLKEAEPYFAMLPK